MRNAMWDDPMYYGDINEGEDLYSLRHFGFDEILQGDGWSDPLRTYQDSYPLIGVDPNGDLDDWHDESLDEYEFGTCRCDADKIIAAAQDLAEFLAKNPKLFPRNPAQVEGFALPGRKTYGSWSRWVDYSRSQPKEFGNVGSISLTGCSRRGHCCRVLMTDEMEIIIDSASTVVDKVERRFEEMFEELELVELGVNEPDPETLIMMEIAEELRYDERNYGLLHAEDLNAEILGVDVDDLYMTAF